MDRVYKKICLEEYISRTPGLMPHLPINTGGVAEIKDSDGPNGNWGNIVCDYVGDDGKVMKYCEMMRRYFFILSCMDSGERAVRINKNGNTRYAPESVYSVNRYNYTIQKRSDYTTDENGLYMEIEAGSEYYSYITMVSDEEYDECESYGGVNFCLEVEKNIGILLIPLTITGDKVPMMIYYSEIGEWCDWFEFYETKAHGGTQTWYALDKVGGTGTDEDKYWVKKLPTGIQEGEAIRIFVNINGDSLQYQCESTVSISNGVKLTFSGDAGALEVTYTGEERDAIIEKDCCIYKEWVDRGDYMMWTFLKNKLGKAGEVIGYWRNAKDKLRIPTIDIPLLMTHTMEDMGIMESYDESEDYQVNQGLYVWVNTDQSQGMKTIYTKNNIFRQGDSFEFYLEIGGEVYDGYCSEWQEDGGRRFKINGVGGMFAYAGKTSDDVYYNSQAIKIDNVTVASNIGSLRRKERTYDDEGNLCPFIITSAGTTDICFTPDEKINYYKVSDYVEIYDCIDSIAYLDNEGNAVTKESESLSSVKFNYTLGKRVEVSRGSYVTGGITYEETYPCRWETYEGEVDGRSGIRYLFVDFDSLATTIYNQDYNLSRKGNITNVKGLYPYEVWNAEDEDGTLATTTAGFKREYLDRVSESPDIKVDVTVARGNATAFEKHLKLGEVSTFNDLIKYGNNYFGLE